MVNNELVEGWQKLTLKQKKELINETLSKRKLLNEILSDKTLRLDKERRTAGYNKLKEYHRELHTLSQLLGLEKNTVYGNLQELEEAVQNVKEALRSELEQSIKFIKRFFKL